MTNLQIMDSTNSGKDQASASQFWKMSRQLPSKPGRGAPSAVGGAISKVFQGRLGSP